MKRYAFALLTSASVIGCQSTMKQSDAYHYGTLSSQKTATAPNTNSAPVADRRASITGQNGEIIQAGYNHGHGAIQNRQFKQRVAAAVPSHGGGLPGVPGAAPMVNAGGPMMGGPGMGMMGPGAMGGMGGPGMAMGGPGGMGPMGGPGAMGGPGCPPGGPGGPGMDPSMMGMGMGGIPMGPRFSTGRSQIRFVQPTGMKIAWQSMEVGASDGFTPPQLEVPARYNFAQARIYRLKLTEIPNRPGMEVYPTLEVYPGNVKIDAYLSHNAIPIELTDEDFDQVQAGNYVTKVIYLPDPKFQELAIAGVETLVSTRLDPGVDPVQEAHRRGSILAVIRVGSVDLEMPHSPSLFPPAAAMFPMPLASRGPADGAKGPVAGAPAELPTQSTSGQIQISPVQ